MRYITQPRSSVQSQDTRSIPTSTYQSYNTKYPRIPGILWVGYHPTSTCQFQNTKYPRIPGVFCDWIPTTQPVHINPKILSIPGFQGYLGLDTTPPVHINLTKLNIPGYKGYSGIGYHTTSTHVNVILPKLLKCIVSWCFPTVTSSYVSRDWIPFHQ